MTVLSPQQMADPADARAIATVGAGMSRAQPLGSTATAAAAEELLQFMYLMPVGVVKFAPSGAIELLNPMASQLVLPLLPEPRLDNIIVGLRELVPELGQKLREAGERLGTIIDFRRIDKRIGGQAVTLSLSVTRVNATSYMAIFKDMSRLTEMLSFAFTAADLLIDVDAAGRINWAGGAFQALFGASAQAMVGQPLSSLIAPRDRQRLAHSLSTVSVAGRMAPQEMRLANAAATRCVIGGMAMEGRPNCLHITIGQAPGRHTLPEHPLQRDRALATEAKHRVRTGQGGVLGLIEIPGWKEATSGLGDRLLQCLRREMADLVNTVGGQSVMMGEIADGRFGVLGPLDAEFGKLGGAMQELMQAFVPSQSTRVSETRIALDDPSLDLTQSVHALRLALARFAGGGSQVIGGDAVGSLASILAEASAQKRAMAALIADGRFELAYQPIVDLGTGVVHHHEALLRPAADPRNPTRNSQEFVVLAEAVGLSSALDFAVLDRAIAMLRRSSASIAVNISPMTVSDALFCETLIARSAGLAKSRLLIEMTETAEIEDMPKVAESLERIRAAGFVVCLDDFGAGSASFRCLRDLRVDVVKIDGAYVRAATKSEQARAFVVAMRDLARSAGAEIIAEMVETEADATLMRELGIGYGQGWLFGKPGPIVETAPKLQRWKY